jgi:hypothetical protein
MSSWLDISSKLKRKNTENIETPKPKKRKQYRNKINVAKKIKLENTF